MHDKQSAAGGTAMSQTGSAVAFVARGLNSRSRHSVPVPARRWRFTAHTPKQPGPELPGNTPVETPTQAPDESPFESPEEHPDSVPPQSPPNPPPEMPEVPRSDNPESPGSRI